MAIAARVFLQQVYYIRIKISTKSGKVVKKPFKDLAIAKAEPKASPDLPFAPPLRKQKRWNRVFRLHLSEGDASEKLFQKAFSKTFS